MWAVTFTADRQQLFHDYVSGVRHTLNDISAAELRPNILVYGKKGLRSWSEPAVLGVGDHELAHILYTDFREMMYAQRRIAARGEDPGLFMSVHNAFEDPRINNLMSLHSPAARERLTALYSEDLGNAEKHASLPLIMQYGMTAHYYWIHGEPSPHITDRRVVDLFERTKSTINQFFVEPDGALATKLFEEKIWPLLKPLRKHLADEQAEDAAADAAKRPDRTLWDRLKNGRSKGKDAVADKIPKELRNQIRENGDTPLTPAMREALRKAIDRLSEEDKKTLSDLARAGGEDALGVPKGWVKAKTPDGKTVLLPEGAPVPDAPKDTPKNEPAREEPEALKDARRKHGFSDSEKELYEQYLKEKKLAEPLIQALVRSLTPVLPRELLKEADGTSQHGRRLAVDRLAERLPVGRSDLFERSTFVERGAPRIDVVLLIDNSGSMKGEKIAAARVLNIALGEALRRLGVRYSSAAFDTAITQIISPEESLHSGAAATLMRKSTGDGGGTDIGAALKHAAEILNHSEKQNADHCGVMIVISDGEPTSGLTGESLAAELATLKRRYTILGVLSSESAEEIDTLINTFGGAHSAVAQSLTEMVPVITRTLARAIQRFANARREL
jgi:Mg-chelatase subunit ChlD